MGKKPINSSVAEFSSDSSGLKFGNAVDCLPQGVRIIKTDYTLLYINPAFAELSGVSREEAIGKKCYEVFPGPFCYTPECRLARITKGDKSVQAEIDRVRADGSVVPCMVSAFPLYNSDNKLIGIMESFRDVTEKRQMQARIEESTTFYNILFESTGTATCILDENGRVTLANKQWKKILGYSREGVNNPNHFTDFLHPDEVDRVKKFFEIRKASPSEIPEEYETRVIDKQGNTRHVLATVRMIPGTGNRIVSALDITELKESESRYKSLVDLSNEVGEGILMLQDIDEKEGVITFASSQCMQTTGYTIEELLGKSLIDLMSPNDRAASLERHRRKMAGESLPGLYEVSIIRKDGTQVPVELTSAVTEHMGKPANVVYLRDITERKRIETELKQSEEKYRTIFDNTGTAVIMVEEDTTIALANEEFERLSGYSREEIQGKKSWQEFVTGEELERLREYQRMRRIDSTSVPKKYETFVVDRQGNVKDIIVCIDMVPGTKRHIASLLDITQLKQRERELETYRNHLEEMVRERTSQLTASNATLESEIARHKLTEEELVRVQEDLKEQFRSRVQFTRALVHELGTFLTPLIAASELLNQQVRDDNLKQLGFAISSAANGLEQRVNELLDLVKGEVGLIKLDCTFVQPGEILARIVGYAQAEALKNEQSFDHDISPTLPCLWADEQRLTQILLNIINNAFKYTPKYGHIALRSWAENNHLLVEISDNGPGLEPEQLSKIFVPYAGIRDSERRVSNLGIGLPLAKMLAEMHNGEIKVESQKDKGSKFSLILPVK